MAPLVMVIEDEEALGLLLKYNLEKEGYEVILETRGNKALAEIEKYGPSVILLDWMLPEISGVEICKLVRSKPDIKNIPIIMLTAKGEEEDKIKGLTAGADDYVTKPFSPIVLAARVRTLLKREGRAGAPLEQLGKLSVNELRREVMVENKPIDLTPKEYELLIYFKNNRAIALSRESILNAVWGYDYFGDLRTVDTHVKKLRAKLGECGTMIETVRGYGYRFEV